MVPQWVVENNRIIGKLENKILVPTVRDILDADNSINVLEYNYLFDLPELTFFKLFGLSIEVSFDMKQDQILCEIYALVNDSRVKVDNLIGYIIYDNVWYFLDSSFEEVISIFDSLKYVYGMPISYFQFIEIKKVLQEFGINVIDNVTAAIDELKNSVNITKASNLNDILFSYQKSGVNWLNFMSDGGCGCILGDEMGLGKTLQIIALFSLRKNQNIKSQFLVVAPLSLLINWKREVEKFQPSLNVLIHHGQQRTGNFRCLNNYDVVITSYSTVQSDLSMFKMIDWDILVLDEAQNIKNPNSKRRNNIAELKSRMNIAVTGTPFENHISDIWSIADFVIPGLFGTLQEYQANFSDDIVSASEIEKSLSAIMIRRKVRDVANDLPDKVDISQPILMSDEEANYYENERNNIYGKSALNQIKLELIQGLRMFCTHPLVYRKDLEYTDPTQISTKYERTCEIIEESKKSGNKVLIFTSFNRMIDIFCEDIPRRFGIPVKFINGSVDADNRQKIIDDFSAIVGPAVLVLNPKAAGAGLNITCANIVIHYNLEWNPAIESQATARSYRRGQKNNVFVYRLYYSGTIEEFINSKIESKQNIFDIAVVGNKGETNTSDLIKALSYSPKGSK